MKLWCAFVVLLLAACNGEEFLAKHASGLVADPPPVTSTTWKAPIGGQITLVKCETLDLKTLLPDGTPGGGTFSVRTDVGPALPSGVTLHYTGILTAACEAPVGSINGVVFDYGPV